MACKSVEFKKFQRRIGRTLHYSNYYDKRRALALARKVSCLFTNDDGNSDFAKMTDNLASQGYLTPCNMLAAMVYIIRLRESNGHEFLQFAPAEIFVSSVILSTKYLNDGTLQDFVWNDEWASASGWDLPRLNQLELRLLNSLGWNASISLNDFEKILSNLEKSIARDMVYQNGVLSYNELFILSSSSEFITLHCLLKMLLEIVIAIMAAYLALITSLIVLEVLVDQTTDYLRKVIFYVNDVGTMNFYTNNYRLIYLPAEMTINDTLFHFDRFPDDFLFRFC